MELGITLKTEVHFFSWTSSCHANCLDSHEQALGVSLAQSPPESQVPSNHTSSAPAVSQPVEPAIFAQVQATASAPENHQTPAHVNSEKGISGKVDQLEGSGEVGKPKVSRNVDEPAVSSKVDYGPMKDFWLRYLLAKGLEKKKNSQPTTSSRENICMHHMKVLEPMSMDPVTKVELILVQNLLLWSNLLVTKWFKTVLWLMKLVLLQMQWEW